MAEAVVSAVASTLLGNLNSILVDEIASACSLKDELNNLQSTVTAIRAVLCDAEEKQWNNESIINWLRRLAHAFYDAEDLLYEFVTEAQRHRLPKDFRTEEKSFFSDQIPVGFEVKMVHKLKRVREKLDAIADVGKITLYLIRNANASQVLERNNEKEKLSVMLLSLEPLRIDENPFLGPSFPIGHVKCIQEKMNEVEDVDLIHLRRNYLETALEKVEADLAWRFRPVNPLGIHRRPGNDEIYEGLSFLMGNRTSSFETNFDIKLKKLNNMLWKNPAVRNHPLLDIFTVEVSMLHSMKKYLNLEKQSAYAFGQNMYGEHMPRKIMFLEQSIHCMKADNDLEKQSDSVLGQDTGRVQKQSGMLNFSLKYSSFPLKETKRNKDMDIEARKHVLEPTPPHPSSNSIFQEDIAHSLLLMATVFASMSLLGALLPGHGTSGSSSSAVKLGLLVWLNSVVFFSSLGLIVFLLHKLPIMPWLLITVSSAIGVYMCAVGANSPGEVVPVIWIGSSIFLVAFMQNAYNCTHWVRTKFLRLSII